MRNKLYQYTCNSLCNVCLKPNGAYPLYSPNRLQLLASRQCYLPALAEQALRSFEVSRQGCMSAAAAGPCNGYAQQWEGQEEVSYHPPPVPSLTKHHPAFCAERAGLAGLLVGI